MFTVLLLLSAQLRADYAQALGYEPKYGDDFEHFDYVNPQAPAGGRVNLASVGSFDSFNPFILKGMAAAGLNELMFETLMEKTLDEPYSQYGLLADDVELAEDGLSVTYRINVWARFNDGSKVGAADVKFSFDTLREKGHPFYRLYLGDIESAEVLDEQHVRFNFKRSNPELHMIVGELPVFSRAWLGNKDFTKVALEKPVTSGPYLIEQYELGKHITYKKNPDYWAANLPVRRGMFNFTEITFKYYRDLTVSLEGLKAGEFDFNHEYNSKKWARDYIGAKFRDKRIIVEELKHQNNAGMQGFIFNLRRPLFQDIRVRRAINLALDFEWSNRQLFYGQYERCDSYFSNSDLAAGALPQGRELELLEPYWEQLPAEVFLQEWQPPSTAPPSSLRKNLRQARALLQEAGWEYSDGALRNEDGEPFAFEIILAQKGFERIVAPFARNLGKLGIDVEYRTIDRALYQKHMDTFDFDMVVTSYNASQSPGNELISRFHSSSADEKGSNNLMGLKDPVVDALLDSVVYAKDRCELITAAHALDRVLLNGDYLVPHWYIGTHRIAYWDRFGRPQHPPLYYDPTDWLMKAWWANDQKGRTH